MRRARLLICGIPLLLALLGCGDDSGDASGVVARAALAITPRYLDPHRPIAPPRPGSFVLSLLLFADGGGIVGTGDRSASTQSASIAEIGWQRAAGGAIDLDPGEVGTLQTGRLHWTRLTLQLHDADGDGTLDAGEGSFEGAWSYIGGDVIDRSDVDGGVGASPDRAAPEASLLSAEFLEPGLALPTDPLRVFFSEPIEWESARQTRIRIDGVPLPAAARPANLTRGLVTGIVLEPRGFLPFEGEIDVDVSSVGDPSGNPAAWDGAPRTVSADPGDLLHNPGFENGFEHWITSGSVESVGSLEGIAPPEGKARRRSPARTGFWAT